MGQAEIVVAVVQGQLLSQAVFAFTQGGDAPADRRHMLADAKVKAFYKRGVDLPATGREDLLHRLPGAEDHPVFDTDQAPAPRRLDDLRIEQLRAAASSGAWAGGLWPGGARAALQSGSQEISLSPSPLRTVHAPCDAHGSSKLHRYTGLIFACICW